MTERDGYEESGPPNGNGGGYWDKQKIERLEARVRALEAMLTDAYFCEHAGTDYACQKLLGEKEPTT